MDSELKKALGIRYVKLHFTVVFLEDALLPRHKVSAIRGGIGEMLLRANCIRNRECETCDFTRECIVQRTLYSQFDRKPEFVTTGESVGYVLECEDYRESYAAGDTLEFKLLLFGKTIVYFNQFLQALYQLGMYGLGKEKARFQIAAVSNTRGQPILEGNNVYMEQYQVEYVRDYAEERLRQIGAGTPGPYTMHFRTPLTLKYHNEFIQEFQMEPIIRAVRRRIYMLDCFENIDGEAYYQKEPDIPEQLEQRAFPYSVKRVSFRKNQKIILKGIRGQLIFNGISDEELALLLAGELIHIGKNTSFGFGKYSISGQKEVVSEQK